MTTIEKNTTQTLAGLLEELAGTHPGYDVDARLERAPAVKEAVAGDETMAALLELERQLEDLDALTTLIRGQRNQIAGQRAAAPKHHGDMKVPLTITGLTRSGLQEVNRIAALEAAPQGRDVPAWYRRLVGRGRLPMERALELIPGIVAGDVDKDDVEEEVRAAAEERAGRRATA